jgi:hypothetical protein
MGSEEEFECGESLNNLNNSEVSLFCDNSKMDTVWWWCMAQDMAGRKTQVCCLEGVRLYFEACHTDVVKLGENILVQLFEHILLFDS